MVNNFNFSRLPEIIFGAGKISVLPDKMSGFGKTVLLITGEKSLNNNAKWQEVIKRFEDGKRTVYRTKVGKEPTPAMVDKVRDEYRGKKVDVVVAIGGGSVMDTGKSVSAMLPAEGSVKDYLEGVGTKKHNGKKVPFIAIPTTSGTGSETTNNAVIAEVGSNGFKKSLRHENFVPDITIVDPELTMACPVKITAYSGMDAFTQLLESYVSVKAGPFTDVLAFEGLKHIQSGLLSVNMDSKKNLNARADMAYASMISGITLSNAGLGTVHGFASSIGGYFEIPHGMICGTLMATCNKITIQKLIEKDKENVAVQKYLNVARLFVGGEIKKKEELLFKLIEKLEVYTDLLQMPKLGQFGIQETDFERIVEATANKNNPYQLSKDDMMRVLWERV